MSLEFSAMQLIFGESSPSVSDMTAVFAVTDEDKITIDDVHYLVARIGKRRRIIVVHRNRHRTSG